MKYFIDKPNVRIIIQNEIKKLPDLDALYFTFYKAASNKRVKAEISDLIKLYNTITSLDELVEAILEQRTGGQQEGGSPRHNQQGGRNGGSRGGRMARRLAM